VPTITEAAHTLGISTDTVRRRIKDGTLAATLVNGRYDVQLTAEATEPLQDGHSDPWERLVEQLTREVEELRHQLEMKDQQIGVKDRQIFELHQMIGVKALEGGNTGRKWWNFWSR